MSRISCFTVVLCLTVLAGGADVAVAAEAKIGIIDTQKIMRESKPSKKAKNILAKDLESKRAKFMAEEDQARKLGEELKRDGQNMTPAARQEKAEKLEREIKELNRLKSDLEEDFRKKDAEVLRRILGEIGEIVKEFRKKEKYTVILDKRSIVAADESIDITDKIIRLYDEAK